MPYSRFLPFAILAVALSIAPAGRVRADLFCDNPAKMDTEQTITTGIVYQKFHVHCPKSKAGGPEADTFAHLAIIQLKTSGLKVLASTPNMSSVSTPRNASFLQSLPTSVFSQSSSAQIAINANLFTSCCTDTQNTKMSMLRGLEVAGSKMNTSPRTNLPSGGNIPTSATFAYSLLIDSEGLASIWKAVSASESPPAGTVTAVTGSHQIVAGSRNTVSPCATGDCDKGQWLGPSGRTAVGLRGRSTLLLLVVDGIDHNKGLSLYQLGEVLASLGADNGINLDGGGSSTMARRGAKAGEFVVLSKLSDTQSGGQACTVPAGATKDCERYVGAVLWVEAP